MKIARTSSIELHRIKVKVTVGLQNFSPFTTIQTVRSYSSILIQARNLIIGPDSVGGYSLFVSFVCLFVCLCVCVCVCLSVCLSVSPFSQPCFNTETVTFVSYTGMANHRSLLNLDLIRTW